MFLFFSASSPQGSVTSMSIREIEQLRVYHGDNWLQQYENLRENREGSINSQEQSNYEESDQPPSPAEEEAMVEDIKGEPYLGIKEPLLEDKKTQNNCETADKKAESDDEQSDEVSILSHESSEHNTESENNGIISDEIDSDIKRMSTIEFHYGKKFIMCKKTFDAIEWSLSQNFYHHIHIICVKKKSVFIF